MTVESRNRSDAQREPSVLVQKVVQAKHLDRFFKRKSPELILSKQNINYKIRQTWIDAPLLQSKVQLCMPVMIKWLVLALCGGSLCPLQYVCHHGPYHTFYWNHPTTGGSVSIHRACI